jgi:hypothetical protein
MDDLNAHDVAAQLPMPVKLSYDFADALVVEHQSPRATGPESAELEVTWERLTPGRRPGVGETTS